jgi:uncharacterized membrane protein YphA (DoxX/SURF4 family)
MASPRYKGYLGHRTCFRGPFCRMISRVEGLHVNTAYLVITLVFAAMVAFSGLGKIRGDPRIVHVIKEVVGVPLKYFSLLAACELAGALGLVLGIWWPLVGVAASIGLVVYFVGATVSHLRVGDVKGIGPAAFMLALAAGALALRILTRGTPQ